MMWSVKPTEGIGLHKFFFSSIRYIYFSIFNWKVIIADLIDIFDVPADL